MKQTTEKRGIYAELKPVSVVSIRINQRCPGRMEAKPVTVGVPGEAGARKQTAAALLPSYAKCAPNIVEISKKYKKSYKKHLNKLKKCHRLR
jgi:hypothetical protein